MFKANIRQYDVLNNMERVTNQPSLVFPTINEVEAINESSIDDEQQMMT